MAKRAGQIVITLSSGQAQFIRDMDLAKAKVKDFGGEFNRVSRSVKESSGFNTRYAIFGLKDVMEGRTKNALAEVVNELTRMRGAMLAFTGTAAGIAVVGYAAYELNKYLKETAELTQKLHAGWIGLQAPIRLSNDELAVANDRLSNEIAKLEGKRQNTLKLSLDEARVAADQLAESLDGDLTKVHKLLDEQNVGIWRQLLGQAGTKDITKEIGGETGFGGFRGQIASITDEGNAKVRAATDLKSKDAAQTELNTKLTAAYAAELAKVNKLIEEAIERGKDTRHRELYQPKPGSNEGAVYVQKGHDAQDERARLELLRGVRRQLQAEQDSISLKATNQTLTVKKDALTANASNAELDRPFEDRMKAMGAQLEGIKTKMAATGQGEAAEVLAKSFASAQAAIEEVNKALERRHTKLTANQEDQIRNREFAIADAEAEAAWKTKLDSTTDSIENRIRSMRLLAAAIGAGYEATKKASVETNVMAAVPKGAYGDETWMKKNAAEVSGLRSQFGKQYDTEHAEETGKAVYALQQQVELEKSLAKAQAAGAEAVRFATLMHNLKTIAQNNDAESAKKLMAAEIELFKAQRENNSAAALAKIREETEATERLTAAVFKGAEAARLAALENKYAEMKRSGVAPEVITATRTQDQAAHQEQISAEAAKMATSYTDALDRISQLTAKLQEAKATQGDTLGIELALRDLENQRLKVLADQALAMRGAADGVRAFFLDMQQSAKSAADVIYEAMHSALDKASNEIANLLTGQHTNWGKMFQDIGHQVVESTVKSGIQTALGKLGGGKADGSSANSALWVRMAGGVAIPTAPAPASGAPGAPTDSGGIFGGILRRLGLGPRPGNVLNGNGGLLGTGGIPGRAEPGSIPGVTGKPDGSTSNPLGVFLAPNVSGPDGSAGNPFYVIQAGSGFGSNPIDFGKNEVKQPTGENGLQTAGAAITDIVDGIKTIAKAKKKQSQEQNALGTSNAPGEFQSTPINFGSNKKAKQSGQNGWQKAGSIITGIASALGSVLGNAGGGGGDSGGDTPDVSSTISYPGLATGGPVKSGASYIVGEKGPELFRSATAGHIVDHETTKRLARAGMLPEGVKVPGVTAKPFNPVKSNAFTDAAAPKAKTLPNATPKRLTPRADGGSVSAGDSYIVGERGPEAFVPDQFSSSQADRRTQGGGGNVAYYTIDARGTDPNLVEMRVRHAIVQAHGSAITTAIQGNVEREKRTPQRA